MPVGGPAPTDPSLAAFTLKSATFAVGSYGGYASNKTIIQSGAALAHALSTDKVAFNDEIVFAASYDAPYRYRTCLDMNFCFSKKIDTFF